MAGFFALNSKAIWAIGLGLAGAVGAGTFIKTESGQPLAVALVEKIRGNTDAPNEELATKTDLIDKSIVAKKDVIKITEKPEVELKKPELKQPENKNQDIAKVEQVTKSPIAELTKKSDVQTKDMVAEKSKEVAALEKSKTLDATQKNMPTIAANKSTSTEAAEAKITPVENTPPSIDLLRVARDGYVVMAGRAEPNFKVFAYNGSTQIGETKSNATGDYVFVFDEPLKTGEHELIVTSGNDADNMKSSLTSGVVILPENKDDMIVLLSKPGEASKILQMPSSRFGPKVAKLDGMQKNGETTKSTPKLPIAINAVDVEEKRYYIAGAAKPQSTVNVYIDNKFKGKAITGEEGAFLYYGRESISVGQHALRVDMLGPDNATVVARAEVVLEHETKEMKSAKMAAAKVAEDEMKAETKVVEMAAKVEKKLPNGPLENAAISSGSIGKKIADIGAAPAKKQTDKKVKTKIENDENAVVKSRAKKVATINVPKADKTVDGKKVIKSGSSVIIRRGDSLWKVSRRKFGAGRKYTIIYSANRDQIQNPHRIYPGQVLDIPDEEKSTQ